MLGEGSGGMLITACSGQTWCQLPLSSVDGRARCATHGLQARRCRVACGAGDKIPNSDLGCCAATC